MAKNRLEEKEPRWLANHRTRFDENQKLRKTIRERHRQNTYDNDRCQYPKRIETLRKKKKGSSEGSRVPFIFHRPTGIAGKREFPRGTKK